MIVILHVYCFIYVTASTSGQRLFQGPPSSIAHRREKSCRSSVQHCRAPTLHSTTNTTCAISVNLAVNSSEYEAICRLDEAFLSLTEKTTPNIRTPSNFSRFLPLRSTVKNGIDKHDEAKFPSQVKKRRSSHEVRYL